MVTIDDVKCAILLWALQNGISTDKLEVPDRGDLSLVPFPNETIEFFRRRKIVRVTVVQNPPEITIFARQAIAKSKAKVPVSYTHLTLPTKA